MIYNTHMAKIYIFKYLKINIYIFQMTNNLKFFAKIDSKIYFLVVYFWPFVCLFKNKFQKHNFKQHLLCILPSLCFKHENTFTFGKNNNKKYIQKS